MVGIWAAAAWQAAGSPRRARLVELGPGRGTLMADLLRGTAGLRAFAAAAAEVDLVEVATRAALCTLGLPRASRQPPDGARPPSRQPPDGARPPRRQPQPRRTRRR